MKNVTPVSDQDIDVDGPARDERAPARPAARPQIRAAIEELRLPRSAHARLERLAALASEASKHAHAAVERAVECGQILIELTADQGLEHGGARRGQDFKVSRDTLKISVEEIAQAVGISRKTAYRYMELAKAINVCAIAEDSPCGGSVTWEGRSISLSEETQAKLARTRAALYSGELALNRAKPAVAGILTVKGGAGTGGKAATNHYRNCETALIKLATSLEHYHRFSDSERFNLDTMLRELLSRGGLPENWRMIYDQVLNGGDV